MLTDLTAAAAVLAADGNNKMFVGISHGRFLLL